MSNASHKVRENPASLARMSFLVALLLGLMIAFAPVLHGHPADQSDQTTATAIPNADQAAIGHDGEPTDPAGLSCHSVGGCSAGAMLPGAVQAHGTSRRQIHRRLGSTTWIARQVAPDSKPPIA
jgi:hypothetical protein